MVVFELPLPRTEKREALKNARIASAGKNRCGVGWFLES
jgi:hypothetical protein